MSKFTQRFSRFSAIYQPYGNFECKNSKKTGYTWRRAWFYLRVQRNHCPFTIRKALCEKDKILRWFVSYTQFECGTLYYEIFISIARCRRKFLHAKMMVHPFWCETLFLYLAKMYIIPRSNNSSCISSLSHQAVDCVQCLLLKITTTNRETTSHKCVAIQIVVPSSITIFLLFIRSYAKIVSTFHIHVEVPLIFLFIFLASLSFFQVSFSVINDRHANIHDSIKVKSVIR